MYYGKQALKNFYDARIKFKSTLDGRDYEKMQKAVQEVYKAARIDGNLLEYLRDEGLDVPSRAGVGGEY